MTNSRLLFWLSVAAAFAALCVLNGCAAFGHPATVAAVASAGTAGVDGTLGSLVANGVLDPGSANMFSGWAHLIGDTITNLSSLPGKFQALQDAHTQLSAQVASNDKIALYNTLGTGAAAVGASMLGVRAQRGPSTPAHVKNLAPVVTAKLTSAATA